VPRCGAGGIRSRLRTRRTVEAPVGFQYLVILFDLQRYGWVGDRHAARWCSWISPPGTFRRRIGAVARSVIAAGMASALSGGRRFRGAAAGFTVAGIDRSEEALKQLPDGIRRETADPADPAAARAAVDRIAAKVGPPQVLVNTIGTYRLGEALTATPEDLRLMIDVNVGPALWLTQAVVPYLRDRGSGSIVHVAARPGLEPAAGIAAYAISKAALVHLTRVLDLELRPSGIRVNAVAPQQLDTAKTHPYLTRDALAHAVAPEAVADLIVYLVSDAAAPVSGAIVPAYGP
jgi:NAD(P)-dependent dehydrogenase (short-subunit alcohol dehydrogenase family)